MTAATYIQLLFQGYTCTNMNAVFVVFITTRFPYGRHSRLKNKRNTERVLPGKDNELCISKFIVALFWLLLLLLLIEEIHFS